MSIHTSARYYFSLAKKILAIYFLSTDDQFPVAVECTYAHAHTLALALVQHFQRLLESAYRALQTPASTNTRQSTGSSYYNQLNISTSTMKLFKSCCPTFSPSIPTWLGIFYQLLFSIASVIVVIVHMERNPRPRRCRKRKTIINTINRRNVEEETTFSSIHIYIYTPLHIQYNTLLQDYCTRTNQIGGNRISERSNSLVTLVCTYISLFSRNACIIYFRNIYA